MTVARGELTLDFTPDGAHEDVLSEPAARTTTTTTDSCPGMGIGTTACELADGSADAYLLLDTTLAHEEPAGGSVNGLQLSKGVDASIRLDWFPSCSAGDIDYEVYEGQIGTWDSHVPVDGLCMTGGTTATFDAAAGDRYYLIVPTNGPSEGSYGQDSTSTERPASASPCVIQVLGTCP
jgi:hypothetical protein